MPRVIKFSSDDDCRISPSVLNGIAQYVFNRTVNELATPFTSHVLKPGKFDANLFAVGFQPRKRQQFVGNIIQQPLLSIHQGLYLGGQCFQQTESGAGQFQQFAILLCLALLGLHGQWSDH